jgi:asparagine synthase (glutamine-hydrolysing)
MPGIAGIITSHGEDPRPFQDIERMVKSMIHEGSDVSASYRDERLGLAVGWVGQEGDLADSQPVWNERKDLALVFAGEDSREDSEIEGLRAKGHAIGSGDRDHLVHLFEEKGERVFAELNGVFSGLLIDRTQNRLVLFNDRYGLNRIYYHEHDGAFYFASEAKALLAVGPRLQGIGQDRLAEFFAYGCTLHDAPLFSGLSLVPAGSRWSFYRGRPIIKERYFRWEEWAEQPPWPEEAYEERLRDVFPRALRRCLRGGRKIGISLTGGIDTRMIMAWAPPLPFKRPCYTFGGLFRDSADVRIARKVAAACQQRHEAIRIQKSFFSEFPALAKRSVLYSDGTMDIGGSVELFMNRRARAIAPVRLTGNYGDQVLRRVVGFKPLGLERGIFEEGFARRLDAVGTAGSPEGEDALSFFCTKQLPWHHYARRAIETTQLTVRTPFLDNELVALAYRAPEGARSLAASLRLIAAGDPALARIATDRGVILHALPVVGALRRWASTFTFKAEYAYDYGMPPWLARLDRRLGFLRLESLFLGRHKFYHFRTWYRNELKRYVMEMLLDARTLARPYLNGKGLEGLVGAHMSGRANYTQEIHWILTSELIQRHLVERSGRAS